MLQNRRRRRREQRESKARRKNHGENSPNKINTNPNGVKRGLQLCPIQLKQTKLRTLSLSGVKRGVGGKKKEVQFYDSFTYDDGADYILHDCVYMYKEGEPKPYIGKLIKTWENGDKTKKSKGSMVLPPFRDFELASR